MRGLIVTAACLSACSYDPSRLQPPIDEQPDGSVAMPDAAIDAAPTWTVVETIIVDSANPNPEVSKTVLDDGVTYRLRVSGTISTVIDSFDGDAEYVDFNDPRDNGCCEDIGLGIDDLVVNDLDTKPDWGPYRDDHIYEVEWVGQGATITALFQDTFYDNNVGNLTLEILALQ